MNLMVSMMKKMNSVQIIIKYWQEKRKRIYSIINSRKSMKLKKIKRKRKTKKIN